LPMTTRQAGTHEHLFSNEMNDLLPMTTGQLRTLLLTKMKNQSDKKQTK